MIVLLGGSGYVGGAFRQYFEQRGLACRSISRRELNYGEVAPLASFLREVRPKFLICAAGYTGKPNVDACEVHKMECLLGNAVLPGIVQAACEQTETPWGHVSSGCIFTGDKGTDPSGRLIGFSEEDVPNFSFRQNNCSFYSGTKALGEEVLGFGSSVLGSIPNSQQPTPNSQHPASQCYLWRLRIPFNNEETPRNYITKVLRYDYLLEATNSLSELREFVRACWECFEKKLPFGLYNVTNPGYIATHELTEMIKKSGVSNKNFQFFSDESDFMRKAAKTPRSNCVLDSTKILRHGIQLTEVHEALEIALKNWRKA
jgi:dTDP-4-dehydrorhamnose reductase